MSSNVTRRSFFKGAGLAALGVPGLSGIGCQLAVLGAGAQAFAQLTQLGAGLAVRAFSTFDA